MKCIVYWTFTTDYKQQSKEFDNSSKANDFQIALIKKHRNKDLYESHIKYIIEEQ